MKQNHFIGEVPHFVANGADKIGESNTTSSPKGISLCLLELIFKLMFEPIRLSPIDKVQEDLRLLFNFIIN